MSRAGTAAESSFDDRLVAECVRVLERDGHQRLHELEADEQARQRGGDLESRIIARAGSLSIAGELRRAIHQLRAGITWIIVIGLLIAFLLGAATARTTMTPIDGTRINFYWVLGGVLGVQSILLIIWIIAAASWRIRMARSPRDQTDSPMLVSLGRLVVAIGQWLGTKLYTGSNRRAVIPASGSVFTTGRIGFWTFSSITHAIWLAFNIGALTLLLLLLSMKQFTFVWETTILNERHYVTLTEWLSGPARLAGFAVPTDADIAQSQWTGAAIAPNLPEGASHRWAGLLAASIVLYGFGPRVLLLGLSMSMRRSACRAFRLDTALPEYQRLRGVLMPQARSLGVVDPEDSGDIGSQIPGMAIPGSSPQRAPGPPAIVGLEIMPPDGAWPPMVNGVTFTNLGLIESREDRARLIETLQSSETEPSPLIIVSDLTNTPDRGLGHALGALAAAVHRSPVLVLSAGQKLRERGYDEQGVAQRIANWRELANRSGIGDEAIMELDLESLTDAAAAQLAERVGIESAPRAGASASRKIEPAFALIEQHARTWLERGGAPSESDLLSLHREIAGLYREQSVSFRSLLSLKPDAPQELMREISSGASRFVDLLPARLRRSPRWLAAGALAGAFGCVATSALISPIAIAALPSWSAIGAAIAAAVQPFGSGGHQNAPVLEPPDHADAVRAAAIFAVTLELQGQDEATITRVLNDTFDEDESVLMDGSSIRTWLDARRHRFDLALSSPGAAGGRRD